MKNLFILPSEKPSRLIIHSTLLNEFRLLDKPIEDWKHKKNIYITNDEEIKEGDYGILGKTILSYHQMHKKWGMPQGKKIILTTDQDLIADGVQSIPDEFLEWFVKNPSCEEVGVSYEPKNFLDTKQGWEYEIIIPEIDILALGQIAEKGETKYPIGGYGPGFYTCTCVTCKTQFQGDKRAVQCEPCAISMTKEKPKQETLEEVAENYFNNFTKRKEEFAFIDGAKWQQEQILDFLYSEITERRDYSASKMCEKVIEFILDLK